MAAHSSVLAWRIPGMEEPGGLPSMGSHRIGHDWNDLAAAAAAETTKSGGGLGSTTTNVLRKERKTETYKLLNYNHKGRIKVEGKNIKKKSNK